MKTLMLLISIAFMSFTATTNAASSYFIDQTKLPFTALPGATAYWGVHTNAGYHIEVPDDWNGELVVWAHGFRGFGKTELTVDDHPMRHFLIAQGYAWAASSYSRNDYDVTTGVQDTLALLKRFNGIAAKPDKIYMTGLSMGGHITAVIIEQFPKLFAGAMPICGAVGDYETFDFVLDFNLAAQQLGTDTSIFPVEPFTYVTATVPSIKANLESAPNTWPVGLNQQGENLKNLVMLHSGGDRPNFDSAWFFWNNFAEVESGTGPGNFLFDLGLSDGVMPRNPGNTAENIDVVYQFDTNPELSPEEQAFNDSIFRVALAPQSKNPNGLSQVPVINGNLPIPVLTMHNIGDLFVPIKNEIAYATKVKQQGKQDLLVTRAYRGVMHCDFTANEMVSSFLDLVDWVENGNKPAGDDFLDANNVAADDFGCQFTYGNHPFDTACPG
ncbi:hypothetical protein RI844_07495 [Thalassotalea fonticola]|uniref:Phthalyl amidase n=1 Tax=Thalassotalea fonticola TaxID=3065649 RepID=A0ABZ0GSY4_9GAMM|nr:hypothetical protein RI844_07495 [Colwelliaceae bacterium S1-1]